MRRFFGESIKRVTHRLELRGGEEGKRGAYFKKDGKMIEGSFECEEGSSIAARKNKAIHQSLSSVALTLLNRPKTIQHRRSTRLFLHFFGVKLKAVKTNFLEGARGRNLFSFGQKN